LNPWQVGALKNDREWRGKRPNYGSLLLGNWKRTAILAALISISAFGCALMGLPEGGLVFLGIWIGALLADIGRIRTTLAALTILPLVLDWSRVEQGITDQRLT
jgi:energy-converting hydrogenase Eha subunit B